MTVTPEFLDEVHNFWFGPLDGPLAQSIHTVETWFQPSDAFDQTIRERFGDAIVEAAAQDWELRSLTRQQQVGLVVLLDQFPRNIHRTGGKAFAFDPVVLAIANELIAAGIDRFYLVERSFVLLPLMHSEDVVDQDRCVMLFATEALKAPDEWKEAFRNGLDFATKHRDLIRTFGRYPHRNEMLGRASTPEEVEFLEKNGRGF